MLKRKEWRMHKFYAVCISPKGDDILLNNAHRIVIQSIKKECLSTFGPAGMGYGFFKSTYGICSWESRIMVTDSIDRKVYIFDSDYTPISSFTVDCIRPRWICCSQSGNILLSGQANLIWIYNQSGHLVRMIDTRRENELNIYLEGICCNSLDEIIVCCKTEPQIRIFSQDGTHLRLFHLVKDHLRCPCAICVDRNDNIFVSDCEQEKINIFSTNGILIKHIDVSSGLNEPLVQEVGPFYGIHGLCIHKREIVAINNDGLVYRFSN